METQEWAIDSEPSTSDLVVGKPTDVNKLAVDVSQVQLLDSELLLVSKNVTTNLANGIVKTVFTWSPSEEELAKFHKFKDSGNIRRLSATNRSVAGWQASSTATTPRRSPRLLAQKLKKRFGP